jgi:hypothetical protein
MTYAVAYHNGDGSGEPASYCRKVIEAFSTGLAFPNINCDFAKMVPEVLLIDNYDS